MTSISQDLTRLSICSEPIFVVGAPRSGTSMMQHALRRHPALWGGEESDFLVPLSDGAWEAYQAGRRRGELHWLSSEDVSWEEFLAHLGAGVNALYTQRSDGLRWVEQTPQYTLHLDTIRMMFPGARFLFMLRDGRQVVSSLREFVNPVRHDRACQKWRAFTEAGLEFGRSEHGDRLLTVSYEDVVRDTDAAVRRIYAFLGLDHEPASVEFVTREHPINSSFGDEASSAKIVPRWRWWTPEERQAFDEIAGDLLIALGFERDRTWVQQDVAP